MLAYLLERAVDPNTQSYAGQTPLQVAAGHGYDACLRLLLSENAQPDLGDHAACSENCCTGPADSNLCGQRGGDIGSNGSHACIMQWIYEEIQLCMRQLVAGTSLRPGHCWLAGPTQTLSVAVESHL